MWNYGTNWSIFSLCVEKEYLLSFSVHVNNIFKLSGLMGSRSGASFWNFCMFIRQVSRSSLFYFNAFRLLE